MRAHPWPGPAGHRSVTEKGRYRLLRAANHRRMPWKNGLGVTTEMVVEPGGATLQSFDWRLSMARIDAEGQFSSFPNIDRLLMVLEGNLHLAIEGRETIELAAESEAVKFPGELAVVATLPQRAGVSARPVTDLNLMVRRGRHEPRMRRFEIQQHGTFLPTAMVTALICRTPNLRISHEQGSDTLQHDDVILINGRSSHPLELSHSSAATFYAVELD